MNKTFIYISFAMLLLTGCVESRVYEKIDGEVVGTHESSGRYGTSYYIRVSYPVGDGKFSIDNVYVGDNPKALNDYKINEKVTVFVDEDGLGEIVKKSIDKSDK